jgi:hypothetical protein
LDATPPQKSPLSKNHDLSKATEGQLRQQLRYELGRAQKKSGLGREDFAFELGYKSVASVTKWLNDHVAVTLRCAAKLDELGYEPYVGKSFRELHQAYTAAKTREGGGQRSRIHYDLFLASPMASLDTKTSFETEHQAACDVKYAIEHFLGLSVYYAGETVKSKVDFDSPLVAAEQNFDALHNARYFVLLSVSKAKKPSSVTVEAGYALARGIPSLYLVSNTQHLPFVLSSLGSHKAPQLPAVDIEVVESGERAVGLIKRQGEEILTRLEAETLSQRRPQAKRRTKGKKKKG